MTINNLNLNQFEFCDCPCHRIRTVMGAGVQGWVGGEGVRVLLATTIEPHTEINIASNVSSAVGVAVIRNKAVCHALPPCCHNFLKHILTSHRKRKTAWLISLYIWWAVIRNNAVFHYIIFKFNCNIYHFLIDEITCKRYPNFSYWSQVYSCIHFVKQKHINGNLVQYKNNISYTLFLMVTCG